MQAGEHTDAEQAARRAQTGRLERPPQMDGGLQTGFVTQYLDAPQTIAQYAALHAAYPRITQWLELPFRTYGYDGAAAGLHGPAVVTIRCGCAATPPAPAMWKPSCTCRC